MARPQTDWDSYYGRGAHGLARRTRHITENHLIRVLKSAGVPNRPVIAELGGGDSSFYHRFDHEFNPLAYYVIDLNDTGLRRLKARLPDDSNVHLQKEDVLELRSYLAADIVFSVGLIEHFEPPDTRRAVETHLRVLRPGGLALISFPTPTILYRVARAVAELTGQWIFHDERPIDIPEVKSAVHSGGEVVSETINWAIVLTQAVMLVRKHPVGSALSP
jgi:SAM-dependent methyltransferase